MNKIIGCGKKTREMNISMGDERFYIGKWIDPEKRRNRREAPIHPDKLVTILVDDILFPMSTT